VEQICTHAAIVQGGRLVAHGPVGELIASADASSLEGAYLSLVR
jgi:ABC-type methionine transport system ATPase subunit